MDIPVARFLSQVEMIYNTAQRSLKVFDSIKNWMGPNPNGPPYEVSCDRAIRFSGLGVRNPWVLLGISGIDYFFILLTRLRRICDINFQLLWRWFLYRKTRVLNRCWSTIGCVGIGVVRIRALCWKFRNIFKNICSSCLGERQEHQQPLISFVERVE